MEMAELLWAGAHAQARALRDGAVRAPDLLEAVLERIALVDPRLNLFRIVHTEAARAGARDAQVRLDAGESTPLLGVPVVLKDDEDVAGDVTPVGGRPQLPPARADSAIVARLREAGAVLVGKTNVPERTQWPFTETLTYGATRNPWAFDRGPGGSSGGSAGAVAAGVVGVATASDGGGSIRIPAAACGVFGVKTTRGLVSMAPRESAWHGLSVYGPLGRTVADAAAMLDVIADEASAERGPTEAPDEPSRAAAGTYAQAAAADPGPLRIALAWRGPLGPTPIDADRRRAVAETARRLRAVGHEVVERELPLSPVLSAGFVVRYLRGIADDVAELPRRDRLEPRTRAMYRLGRLVPDRALAWALRSGDALRTPVGRFFSDVDVVLQPSLTGPTWPIGTFQRRGALATMIGVMARIPHLPAWNVLGCPVAALPVGRDREGCPMGVQLVGPWGAERVLLSLAGQLERDRPWVGHRPAEDGR